MECPVGITTNMTTSPVKLPTGHVPVERGRRIMTHIHSNRAMLCHFSMIIMYIYTFFCISVIGIHPLLDIEPLDREKIQQLYTSL